MSKPNQKSKEMRNNINERMQNFYIGNNTNHHPSLSLSKLRRRIEALRKHLL